MHQEIKAKLEPICKMKETLTEWSKSEIDKGKDTVDGKELGDAIDMVKDLAEAEKSCWEAAYYESIVKAMEGEESTDERYGYNTNRSATTGRYTSGRMGFNNVIRNMPYIDSYLDDDIYGYSTSSGQGYGGGRGGQGGTRGSSQSSTNNSMGYIDTESMSSMRNGAAYRDYENARRHYTETKSPADKKEMDSKAMEHVMNAVATMRDIWKDADPEMRKQIKADITKLVNEMN